MAEKMIISSTLAAAAEVEESLLEQVAKFGYDEPTMFAIKLALEEGLNNAIKHGNGFDSAKSVELSFEIDSRQVVITITDEGTGFDPASVPDPTMDENLEKPCGRGIMLMRAYMDEVQYNSKGNQVRLVKRNT